MTPQDLARKHGMLQSGAFLGAENGAALYPHSVADVLNGWTRHERLTGAAVELSDATYLAALEAAKLGKSFEDANCRKQQEGA